MFFLSFPLDLYPACAPLSAPMANHLLSLEARRHPETPHEILFKRVLAQIASARSEIFEYLDPFVRAEKLKREEVPSPRSKAFLLRTLAPYTPNQHKYANVTIKFWTQKGILRRPDGELLDIQSVAALLIARNVEDKLERGWLPPGKIDQNTPAWWCYAQSSPDSPVRYVAMPFDWKNPAVLLWTPWCGAAWDDPTWQVHGKQLFRWSGEPSLQDLRMWDTEIPDRIGAMDGDTLLRKNSVQSVLLVEARNDILSRVAQERK